MQSQFYEEQEWHWVVINWARSKQDVAGGKVKIHAAPDGIVLSGEGTGVQDALKIIDSGVGLPLLHSSWVTPSLSFLIYQMWIKTALTLT